MQGMIPSKIEEIKTTAKSQSMKIRVKTYPNSADKAMAMEEKELTFFQAPSLERVKLLLNPNRGLRALKWGWVNGATLAIRANVPATRRFIKAVAPRLWSLIINMDKTVATAIKTISTPKAIDWTISL